MSFKSEPLSSGNNLEEAKPYSCPDLDEKEVTKDIQVIKLLGKSRFPIYLVYSKTHEAYYAMKVFPYENFQINPSYLSELRFSSLSHTNVISVTEARSMRKGKYKGKHMQISYLLIELAPYGDITRHIMQDTLPKNDDKLVRTLFRQLISGLEFLHSKGMAHMDLKLDNLLLGEDYVLKIADFDFCISGNEWFVLGTGTANFRAPEVKGRKCENYKAADIYSAGICLFALKARCLPYCETKPVKGYDLFRLLFSDTEAFWKAYEEFDHINVEFDKDFKRLFESMVKFEPTERATFSQIKTSKWYNAPIYTKNEMVALLKKTVKPIYENNS